MNIDQLIEHGGKWPAYSDMSPDESGKLNLAVSQKKIRIEGGMIVPISKKASRLPIAGLPENDSEPEQVLVRPERPRRSCEIHRYRTSDRVRGARLY